MVTRFLKKLAVHLTLPLAFLLLGYLFLYLAFSPLINFGVSAWGILSNDLNLGQSEEIYKDIYEEKLFFGYDSYVPSSEIVYPTGGTRYGKILITHESDIYDIPLYFGDTNPILRRGAGHYMGSHFPGEKSTILVSAHNNTYFNCLKYLKIGDIIEGRTNYGHYKYEVVKLRALDKNDSTAFDLSADYENLVLYTCYPFDTLGLTNKRYFVNTKLVSGPYINFHE